MLYLFINSYFDTKIFKDFKFLEVSITKSIRGKQNLKEISIFDSDEITNFLSDFFQANNIELNKILKIFNQNKSILDIKDSKQINFNSQFIDNERDFDEMIKYLLTQSILSIDMEYYKAVNNSQTECNICLLYTSPSPRD